MWGNLFGWLWGGWGGVGVAQASPVQQLTVTLDCPKTHTAELDTPATVTVRLSMRRVNTHE